MKYPVGYCALLAFLVLILSLQTFPQNHIPEKIQFKHLTREQGLSDSFIRCVIQDSKGFMWIGTSDGLDRYDGLKLKAFKYSPDDDNSLSANGIRALYEDRSRILWVGTAGGGLNEYNSEKENFKKYLNDPKDTNSISSNLVTLILCCRAMRKQQRSRPNILL